MSINNSINDYTIYDDGYDAFLSKELENIDELGMPTSMKSSFFSISPQTIASGEIVEHLLIGKNGDIKGGQTAFNTGKGFFLGYDNDAYKFSIGDSDVNKYLSYDGTDLEVTGGTISSANIVGTTITGGLIRTATSGARVELTSGYTSDIRFYNNANQMGYINLEGSGSYSGYLMLYGQGNVALAGGDLFIPNNIIFLSADDSNIGTSDKYPHSIYSNIYYGKNTSIQSFQNEQDIEMIKAIPEKDVVIEDKPKQLRRIENGKVIFEKPIRAMFSSQNKKTRKIFDLSSIERLRNNDNPELIDMGALNGLLIGTLKQLITKVETLEQKVKHYENINRI